MSQIPNITPADLARWYQVKEQVKALATEETLLRQRIFKAKFTAPDEGVNTVPLDDGTGAVLKGTHVIGRTIDEAALTVLGPKLLQAGIPVVDLVKRKPELVVSAYRKLTDEQRNLFDQALTIKPGMPQLEITIPKKAT